MTTYTLHLPGDARPGDPEALDEAEIVKDGFSWGAFFFNFLWFFYHRLWLAGLMVLVVTVGFDLALNALHLHPAAEIVAELLLSILIALEANSLRRWTYERHGMPAVDVVAAAHRDDAETVAFARWLARIPPARRPAQPPVRSPYGPVLRAGQGPEPVIGLFPDAERPR